LVERVAALEATRVALSDAAGRHAAWKGATCDEDSQEGSSEEGEFGEHFVSSECG
jgi:hypothetical protein